MTDFMNQRGKSLPFKQNFLGAQEVSMVSNQPTNYATYVQIVKNL